MTTPAVTTTTPKALETRQRILAAALALFHEQGFDATTMRGIADRAGMAVGATYYYFQTKDEIVLQFYVALQTEMEQRLPDIVKQHTSAPQRIQALLLERLEQFRPYRAVFSVLAQHAGDPQSPLSPFSGQTTAIREQAIALFATALQDAPLSAPKALQAQVPLILWLYQMAIIFFWLHDRSAQQRRTKQLVAVSLPLALQLLRLLRLPPLRPIRTAIVQILTVVGVTSEAAPYVR